MLNLVGDFDSVAHFYRFWSYGRSIRIDRIDSSSGPERDRGSAKSSLPPSPSSFLILYSKMAASLCARASGGCSAKKDERNNVVSLMAGQFQRVRVAPLPLSFFPRRRGVSFFPTRSFFFSSFLPLSEGAATTSTRSPWHPFFCATASFAVEVHLGPVAENRSAPTEPIPSV